MAQQDRVEQFKQDIAEMGVADPAAGRDRLLLILGAILLVVGPVVALVGYANSHGTINPLQQNDATITAIIGLSLTVVGAALFVRYSVARFLRFWLARLCWEQQSQTDRVIEALHATGRAAGSSDEPASRVSASS